MHNKHLVIIAMSTGGGGLEGISFKQYNSQKFKSAYIQTLNTRIFYDLIRQNKTFATSTFAYLVYNYYLVMHSISSPYLQRAIVPKEPILCSFINLQNMTHLVRIAFGDSQSTLAVVLFEDL